jgi:putative oxidoreductase
MSPKFNIIRFYLSLGFKNNPTITRTLHHLSELWLLISRIYVAHIFFKSGLTKIDDWSTTIALFTDEYKVPLLSPYVAAIMGTGGELLLSILLILGLGKRLAAVGLLIINIVAVLSLQDIADAALQQHMFWGWILITLAIIGFGQYSLDYWIGKYYVNKLDTQST